VWSRRCSGLLDESAGLAAATRMANAGTLDLPALAGSPPRRHRPPGAHRHRARRPLARAAPASLEVVWSTGAQPRPVTVVDCGFALEYDEELSYDSAAPRRNGATGATLDEADLVLAVGAADPVGLQRLVRGLAELREAHPEATVRVVVTKLRRGPVGRDPERQVRDALARFAGVRDLVVVPYDRSGSRRCPVRRPFAGRGGSRLAGAPTPDRAGAGDRRVCRRRRPLAVEPGTAPAHDPPGLTRRALRRPHLPLIMQL
jgi:hypothetical protein